MKDKIKLTIKFVAFVTVTCLCVAFVNQLLKPKYYYIEQWPTTNTYKDFYKLPKNSVDVLFMGSSHVVTALNPQCIYDEYGIVSYNLGCEQQSLLVTYYWLKEALKYQSPKIVVLDTYMFHKYISNYVYNNLNCSEGAIRKSMDCMRWSFMLWEAGKEIEKEDPTQIGISFPLLNVRYHTRWKKLDENDFAESSMIEHGGIKGFSAIGGTAPNASYVPFKDVDSESVEAEPMVDIAIKYLEKIEDLCQENGIQLIFIKIPNGESIARYKSTKLYAEEKGIPFYDFNEEKLYNKIGYNAAEDLLTHANYRGAEKISSYIGNLLKTEYGICEREDSTFDLTRMVYEHKIESLELKNCTDIYKYLDLLNNDKYSIMLFAPVTYGACINQDIEDRLAALGFKCDLRNQPDGMHYCAVKDGGSGTIEKLTSEDIQWTGSIRNGLTIYKFTVTAAGLPRFYYKCSMDVAGAECGNGNHAGINIVVYDNDLKSVIDKVNFDTTVPELPATRY